MFENLHTVNLDGTPFQRGLQQAKRLPQLVPQVRAAVAGRLVGMRGALPSPRLARYLAQQQAFLEAHDPDGFEESLGLAQGFSVSHPEILAYLHANVLQDMLQPAEPDVDGCTSWARRQASGGCLVVKNRDYRGEHGVLQQVFLHQGSGLEAGALLCVGSLGSPGAFSSGMNAQGLAVVDTQIGTHDHGVGWLRYFLMTALLRKCATVSSALSMIAAAPHAGGGTLVLGDASGQCASVELSHARVSVVTRSECFVARTNHFLQPELAATMTKKADDLSASSAARLAQVEDSLSRANGEFGLAQAQALMSTHETGASICSHADATDMSRSRTLSCVVYDTAEKVLHMTSGNPCDSAWGSISLTQAVYLAQQSASV